jgi:hypothetical protein
MVNKVGRPSVPKDEARAPGLSVRLTKAEVGKIDNAVNLSGLKRSDWARKALIYVAEHGIRIT